MNKSQLMKTISKSCHLPQCKAQLVLNSIINTMTKSLSEGDPIQLPGFGSFSLSYHPQKKGRNPQTGDSITIPGQNKIVFKAGSKLKHALK